MLHLYALVAIYAQERGASGSFGMLPGGVPRADYTKMGKAELMAAAKDLGMRTHNVRNYRRVDKVHADCEVELAQRASTLDVPSSSQKFPSLTACGQMI